jgi:hypothetical protein
MNVRKTGMKQASPRHGLSEDWRRWIAENLLLGCHPDTVAASLHQAGIGTAQARAEIETALRSPYLQGAQRLRNRLAKRDWVIDIQSRLNRIAPDPVPRHERPSGQVFFEQYYRRNLPVIITGMLDDCAARTRWNIDYFQRQFGTREVEVQFGREADPQYEQNSISHKRMMRFGDYASLVQDSGRTNDFYMTANNDTQNRAALAELWQDVPALPDYLAPAPAGTGFFWFGPAGTITPFHHDLTNNFMAQIIGRKRVLLIAPCEVSRVANLRHCFSQVDGRLIDLQQFPAMAGVPVLDVELAPGEILFLPVGWWHFVEALDIAVTVSATNFRWPNDFYTNYPVNHDF